MTEYIHRAIWEYPDGGRGKRVKKLHRYKPLKVSGLYTHLGKGFPGTQRVLAVKEVEQPE